MVRSYHNPLFARTVGRCLWAGLHQKEGTLVEEKFKHILRRLNVFYVLTCILFAMNARNVYILACIPQEYIIQKFTSGSYNNWVGLLFITLYVVIALWYVQPLVLLLFSESYMEATPCLFLVATYPIRHMVVPPIMFVYILVFTFLSIILGGSFIHILRIIQALILYETHLNTNHGENFPPTN